VLVSRHLEHQVNKHRVPSTIARFLDTYWRSYMTQLCVTVGEQSEAWRKALENTENLTWSLQPKRDDASRKRLYVILPGLFQWVHTVLKSQGVATEEEDLFFSGLSRLQVAALNPDKSRIAAPKPAAVEKPAASNKVAEPSDNGEDGVAVKAETESSRRRLPVSDQKKKKHNAESDVLGNLVIGAFVALQSDRATRRVLRLEWISRGGGVYLFRDQKRGDALCYTAERCTECLRKGSISVMS
jgi:hypothetical protein